MDRMKERMNSLKAINSIEPEAVSQSLSEPPAADVTAEEEEKPLNELLTASMVDIYVGPEKTHWTLHENLLCYYSSVLAAKFDKESASAKKGQNKTYELLDEENKTFKLLVGWLYTRDYKQPSKETDVEPLLDLYLLTEKLEINSLSSSLVETVRQFYHDANAYPSLRRVQYIYANTKDDNAMRDMLVSSIARYLTLSEAMPEHWSKALKNNGELAVDIIRAIQDWNLESRSIPDIRDHSLEGSRILSRLDKSRGEDSFISMQTDDPRSGGTSEDGSPRKGVDE